jgi:hypothetical protein
MRRFFSGRTFGAFCVMVALLMVIAVASEIAIERDLHPRTRFQGLLLETLISVAVAGVLVERMGLHLLDN